MRAINRRTAASVPADAIGAFDFGDYPAPLDSRIDQDGTDPPNRPAEMSPINGRA